MPEAGKGIGAGPLGPHLQSFSLVFSQYTAYRTRRSPSQSNSWYETEVTYREEDLTSPVPKGIGLANALRDSHPDSAKLTVVLYYLYHSGPDNCQKPVIRDISSRWRVAFHSGVPLIVPDQNCNLLCIALSPPCSSCCNSSTVLTSSIFCLWIIDPFARHDSRLVRLKR